MRRPKGRDSGLVATAKVPVFVEEADDDVLFDPTEVPAPATAPILGVNPSPLVARGRLGDLLLESAVITTEQLEAALQVQNRALELAENPDRIGNVLVSMGAINDDQLVDALAA